jgi:hypothetical protein
MAGQILILFTAKHFGSVLNDAVSGEAIHKELPSVVGEPAGSYTQRKKRRGLSSTTTAASENGNLTIDLFTYMRDDQSNSC